MATASITRKPAQQAERHMSECFLEMSRVSMSFKARQGLFQALSEIDLRIAKGEFVCLIGHSGCGKSTLLNIIAGLYHCSSGGVLLDGREVDAPGPDRAVVFQNHSLLPWLTAYENVELAVKRISRGKRTKAQLRDWVVHNLQLVQMDHALHKRPDELSGGMKQRVGIARALAMEPKVLLMDEPFGALDALTRARLQDELMRIVAATRSTVVMVTHDVDEAVLLADRVVMMTNGPAAHIGEVLEVDLPRPRDRLKLVGDPRYVAARKAVLEFLYQKQLRAAA
jgi:nitrate/nitrite transport system ATP-binding protein